MFAASLLTERWMSGLVLSAMYRSSPRIDRNLVDSVDVSG